MSDLTKEIIDEMMSQFYMGIDPAFEPKRSTATEVTYGWKTPPPSKPKVDFEGMKRLKARVLKTTVRSPSGKIREWQEE